MAVTLEQFIDQLSTSGLIPPEKIGQVFERSSPKDAEQFAKLLVKQKVLTPWQAKQIYAGKGHSLVLGNYIVLEKLGQGGMGMVLKAQHRRMKRVVALKVLSPSVGKSPEFTARFHREVEAAAKLAHPNIVTAFDADEARGTPFLVMEYVDGKDLAAVVKSQGPLSLSQACHCVMQAAKGLEYAHSQRIIHRDIKPANLLINRQGVVKILDLGLARMDLEPGMTQLTSTGTVMGTVDYMAPEQALSSKDADARSDIYSLGITLWYLLTGKPAYDGDSLMARMLGHRETTVPSLAAELSRHPTGVRPVSLEASRAADVVFQKMVAKRPEDRYQTMGQVIRALKEIPTSGEPLILQVAAAAGAVGIVEPRSLDGATAARKPEKPAAAQGATVGRQEDVDAIWGSPFAATMNTADSSSATATHRSTIEAGNAYQTPGDSNQAGNPPPKKTGRWLARAWGGTAGCVLLGVIIITITSKDGSQVRVEAPDTSKVEITSSPSSVKPSQSAITPAHAPSHVSNVWQDLLSQVVPNEQNSRGKWTRTKTGHLKGDRKADWPFPELSVSPRPKGSYELEVGLVLHEADHVVFHLPASSGTANLIISRRLGGVTWQLNGTFAPRSQPASQQLSYAIDANTEYALRVFVEVFEDGQRVQLTGSIDGHALPKLDEKSSDLSLVGPPKGMDVPPFPGFGESFGVHVGQGSTATLTRFRYRLVQGGTPSDRKPLAVANPSFEQPDVPDQDTPSEEAFYRIGRSGDLTTVPGWTIDLSDAESAAGVSDPGEPKFEGTGGNRRPDSMPKNGHGHQYGFISLVKPGRGHLTTTEPMAAVEDNTEYTLNVAVGYSLDVSGLGDVSIELLVGEQAVAVTKIDHAQVRRGSFSTHSASFRTGPKDPLQGGELRVRLSVSNGTDQFVQVAFDTVQVLKSTRVGG